MNQKLLALYGIKFNPFSPELPIEALRVSSKVDSFCWRIEHSLVREGGFALISGYEKEPIMERSGDFRPEMWLFATRCFPLLNACGSSGVHPGDTHAYVKVIW